MLDGREEDLTLRLGSWSAATFPQLSLTALEIAREFPQALGKRYAFPAATTAATTTRHIHDQTKRTTHEPTNQDDTSVTVGVAIFRKPGCRLTPVEYRLFELSQPSMRFS